jgi:hypothetical protein
MFNHTLSCRVFTLHTLQHVQITLHKVTRVNDNCDDIGMGYEVGTREREESGQMRLVEYITSNYLVYILEGPKIHSKTILTTVIINIDKEKNHLSHEDRESRVETMLTKVTVATYALPSFVHKGRTINRKYKY